MPYQAAIFFKTGSEEPTGVEIWRSVGEICEKYGFAGFSDVEADGKPHQVAVEGPRCAEWLCILPIENPGAVPDQLVMPPWEPEHRPRPLPAYTNGEVGPQELAADRLRSARDGRSGRYGHSPKPPLEVGGQGPFLSPEDDGFSKTLGEPHWDERWKHNGE